MSLRENKKRKTKRAIFESAITLFNEQGFDKTSIAQIARTAGVGKGTVYSYFSNKKSILLGFCEFEFERIHQQLVEKSNRNASVLEQMLTIYMTEFNLLIQKPEFGRLYLRESLFPEDVVDVNTITQVEDRYFDLLFPILEKGKKCGELREDLDLLYITGHFYSLFVLVMSAWYTRRISTEEVEPAMHTLFSQLLTGLRPTAATNTSEKNHD